MIPKKIYDLCRNGKSVSAELAKNPSEPPYKAAQRIFGVKIEEDIVGERLKRPDPETDDALKQAFDCGNWGSSQPSKLFLQVRSTLPNQQDSYKLPAEVPQVYHDVLLTLEKNPLIGVTSPSLMGSNGVCPLTILAPLPDICRHMSNCIARAEKEVFLATNFWMHSEASTIITNSIRELSRRAGERGQKAVVKIIYDRGNVKQVGEPRNSQEFSISPALNR